VIELFNLTYKYPSSDTNNLEKIILPVSKGSIWGLLGPNGAGKTTLIRCIVGLLSPVFGDVRVFGSAPNRNSLRNIGIVIENSGVYKKMKGREYLKYFGELFDVPGLDARIDSLREQFDIDVDSHVIGKMSQGQKQIIQLMRSLLPKPKLIIWDEPFSNLDPNTQQRVQDIIQMYADKYKSTILIATHQLNLAEIVCDNIFFMNKGKSLYVGTKNHLYLRENNLKCISIEIEGSPDKLTLRGWQDQFKLKIEYSTKPQYLNRRRISRGEPEIEKLYLSGEGLEKKIPEAIKQIIDSGYSVKSVVPEKKDLYNIYTDLIGEKKEFSKEYE